MNAPDPLALLWSAVFGAALGLLFAVFEAAHIVLLRGKAARFATDVLFCLLAGISTFLLALAVENGRLRFFQAGAELIGFLLVNGTVGFVMRRFLPGLWERFRRRRDRLAAFFRGKIGGLRRKREKTAGGKAKKSKKSAKKT